ncbi:hypothetical protein [Falsirhodobacter sp. 20TX0035]|uniref:hypothetical protein n=1 Tax=Falsirhodobacter sp. 20TX0035 TaxID=3022019 RepID=UPI0023312760|nr:hypothetical protein [Falsirhodobacter sp. 20TX0035]MDB6454467.1 hypothetical protein [Falsirhodobacter sp. 20TX0035]
MTPMRILIGCETSGTMRRAFAARGHDVWSCDLLPADDGSNRHIMGDVRDHLDRDWDMIVVAHPPCTRLCNSGVRWLSAAPRGRTLEEMWAELEAGADLFAACWRAKAPRVAIENPIMHKHAKALMPADLPRPQIVQPWWFGEPYFKATGFYLRGLPQLVAANRLTPPRKAEDPARHAAWSKIHRASPGPDRWKLRSATFPGVAAACAEQWSPMVEEMAA